MTEQNNEQIHDRDLQDDDETTQEEMDEALQNERLSSAPTEEELDDMELEEDEELAEDEE